MKIKILGTRGEIKPSAPGHSKKSGALINDELLLDFGEEEFLKYHPKYILITHLHPDHAYFVRHHEMPNFGIPIYAPEKYDDLNIHITNEPFSISDYDITPIPTIHSLKVKSNAYLINYKGKRLLYTGDLVWINKEYHSLFGNLDLVITEASFIRNGGMIRRKNGQLYGHTGIPNLIHVFKNYTNKILFMHFGSWFFEDIEKSKRDFDKLAKENNIEIIVGYDGLELEI